MNIDGVEPTAGTFENSSYTCPVPSTWPPSGELTNEAASDFHELHRGAKRARPRAEDYIPVSGVEPFESNGATGSVTVSGSSSFLMQKLIEGYNTNQTDVSIDCRPMTPPPA